MKTKLSLLYVLTALTAMTACGSDESGSSGESASQPSRCTGHSDCATGEACDFSSSSTMSALSLPGTRPSSVDSRCYELCEETCLTAGVPAEQCSEDCAWVCSDDEQPPVGPDPMLPGDDPADPGGPSDDPSEPVQREGVCRAIDVGAGGGDGSGGASSTGGSPSSSGGSDVGTGGETQAPDLEWAGNWNADLSYTAKCDVVGNISTKSQSHSVTVRLTGSNDDLTLTTGNHRMSGFGNNSSLTLNGTFPVRTTSDKDANTTQKDTKITIRLTNVSSESSASGTIEGTYYSTGFSGKCTVEDGTISFSR